MDVQRTAGRTGRRLGLAIVAVMGTTLIAGNVTAGAQPASANEGSDPAAFTDVDGVTYFTAIDEAHGRELWTTDGTGDGTQMVKDIEPGEFGAFAYDPSSEPIPEMVGMDGRLYFSAAGGLWRSDGIEDGTTLVKDDLAPRLLTVMDGKLYFIQHVHPGRFELWRSNGTPGGTKRIKEVSEGYGPQPMDLIAVGGTLFISVHYRNQAPGALWASDGTGVGTTRLTGGLKSPYGLPADVREMTAVGDTLFFSVREQDFKAGGSAARLWRSDGTVSGTRPVKGIDPDEDYVAGLVSAHDRLFFEGWMGLWSTDGSPHSASLVKPTTGGLLPTMVNADERIYFLREHGDGFGLWRSDGTSQSTRYVRDVKEYIRYVDDVGCDCFRNLFTHLGTTLIFGAYGGGAGAEIWKSDGTAAGTVRIRDIRPIGGSKPTDFFTSADRVYFVANDGTHGRELWATDGTKAGTVLLKDIAQ